MVTLALAPEVHWQSTEEMKLTIRPATANIIHPLMSLPPNNRLVGRTHWKVPPRGRHLYSSGIPQIGPSPLLANTSQRQTILARAVHLHYRGLNIAQDFITRLKDRICTKVTFSAWSITLFGCSSSTVGLRYHSARSAIPTLVGTSRTCQRLPQSTFLTAHREVQHDRLR